MSSDLFNENCTNIGSFIDNGAIILWSYHQTLIWALYFYFKKGNIKKKKKCLKKQQQKITKTIWMQLDADLHIFSCDKAASISHCH